MTALGEEPEPWPQHGEIRIARPRGPVALHEVVPLVEWHDELTVGIEDQSLIARPSGWIWEVGSQPQGGRAVEAAELAASASLTTHAWAARMLISIMRE